METEQFINECEREVRKRSDVAATPDVGGFPTYHDVVVASPFTTGTHRQADGELRGPPYEDSAVEQAEKDKLTQYQPRHGKGAGHLVPLAFDVYGRDGAVPDIVRARPSIRAACDLSVTREGT